jgi:NitT/TauT family transport system substrate-binding protein
MTYFRSVATHVAGATLALLVAISAGHAQDAVKIAFTPTAAAGGIFNAQAEGFFAKHGLKPTELLTQANGVGVVAAVQSGSAQFGSVAAGVFFGAIENGLDFVAVGCQSLFGPGSDVLAVIARNDVNITKASDFEGKRVAVPGLQGGHHLAFLVWLKANGADAKKITFLEVNHAQQADVLRGKSVDAVVTAEPNVVRITQAGLGKVVSRLNDMKQNFPDAFFMATRTWADAHPNEIIGFQAGLKDGVAFGEANFDKTSANTAQFLKQDLAIVKQAGKQHFCTADVAKHVNELSTVMMELGLAKKPMDAAKVVWRKPGT